MPTGQRATTSRSGGLARRRVGAALLAAAVGLPGCSAGPPSPHPPALLVEAGQPIYVDLHPWPYRTPRLTPATAPFLTPEGRRTLLLTFDAAWVPAEAGLALLDFLAAHGIRSTIFVSGALVYADPSRGLAGGLREESFPLIRRIVLDRHEVGSHGLTHPHNSDGVDWLTEHGRLREGWEAAVRAVFGPTPPAHAALTPFWRAPFGEHDDRSLRLSARAGFPVHVRWDVDVHDGLGLPRCDGTPGARCLDAAGMTDRVLAALDASAPAGGGLVVLAHLQNPYDWAGSPDGLERLVTEANRRGLVFRPLSEVFNWELLGANNRWAPPHAPAESTSTGR